MIPSPYQQETSARVMVLLEQPVHNTFKQILLNQRQYEELLSYLVRQFTEQEPNKDQTVFAKIRLSDDAITSEVFKKWNAIN